VPLRSLPRGGAPCHGRCPVPEAANPGCPRADLATLVPDLPSYRGQAATVLFAPHPSNPRSSCLRGSQSPLELEHCFPSVASLSPPARAFSKLRRPHLRPRPPNRYHRLVTSVGHLHLSPSWAIIVPSVRMMMVLPGGGGVSGMVPAAASTPSPSPGAIWSALPLFVLCSDPSCSCPCAIVVLMPPGAVVLAVAPGPQQHSTKVSRSGHFRPRFGLRAGRQSHLVS
jgi:hypothetical protein